MYALTPAHEEDLVKECYEQFEALLTNFQGNTSLYQETGVPRLYLMTTAHRHKTTLVNTLFHPVISRRTAWHSPDGGSGR